MAYKGKTYSKKGNSTVEATKKTKTMELSENSRSACYLGAPTGPKFFAVSSKITAESEHKMWLDHSCFSKYK